MATDFFERQAAARRSTGWLIGMFAFATLAMASTTGAVAWLALMASAEKSPEFAKGPLPWQLPLGVALGTLVLVLLGTLYKVILLRSSGGTGVAEGLGGKRLYPGETVDGTNPPQPGDLLIDTAGGCSTLQTVMEQQGATRLVCSATQLKVAPAMAERFDLVRPVWRETPDGPELERLDLIRPAVVGHLKMVPTNQTEAAAGTLYLVSPEPMLLGDRFQRHRGGDYEVLQIDEPAKIGRPWIVQLAEVAATA